ncbi:Wzz/FepE/Etk N-terminal domain-containing protein [Bradyrhizobium sp. CCGUVB14]|uniref:tyrosine-protein kinase domain-containing protein n=1 Tax=Bradyrhizobium sp. CCGUVB14 TaxID=2949628 RepID=UPI0020B316B2|nr:Wzz/FepE/Etk N-terminal domain-containing protein [Bradyrhizobium sp. CCGUVB14]MCP3443204.1 Wzz/FepE/Etk N-terminal domain-containing protein [Bradyrhizobium sp. CCGUVB14]
MQLMDKTGLIADSIPLRPDYEGPRQDDQATTASEPGFQQVIGTLRRRRKFILTIAGVGAMLAGIAGVLITPKYTATAQVVQVQGGSPLSPEALQQAVDTQVTMLTSPYHLRHVLDSFRSDPKFHGLASSVEVDPAVAPKPAQAESSEAGPFGLKELKRRLGIWIGPLFHHRRADAGLQFDDLQRRLQVLQERRSRIINVTFQWTTPERAADIVNRIVELYVQSNAEQQRAYTRGELARLDERMATVKADIERTSAALHQAIQRRTDAGRNAGGEDQAPGADPRELERRTAASAQLYASLLQRQKEIREQEELVNPDVSILSLASPPSRPSSPNPILFVLPALIVSLICGSFIALVQERLDKTLRSEKEIADAFGLSCVGLVPQIPTNHLTDSGDYIRVKPFSPYAEALRSAAATLRLAEPGHAKTILITSSIAGEGKTTLARGLSAYVGLLGRRALLIGIDLHRGMRVTEFDNAGERQIVGLQHRSLADSIRHIPQAGFDYVRIPGYRLDPIGAVEQIAELIRQLRDRYDCVIIDGPPVLAAIEARLLPSIADKLLFVVKWGSTRREVAQNALDLLRGGGRFGNDRGDFAAAIATQVDLKKHAQYGYGDASEFSVGAAEAPRAGLRQRLLAIASSPFRWMQEIGIQALHLARSFAGKGHE